MEGFSIMEHVLVAPSPLLLPQIPFLSRSSMGEHFGLQEDGKGKEIIFLPVETLLENKATLSIIFIAMLVSQYYYFILQIVEGNKAVRS